MQFVGDALRKFNFQFQITLLMIVLLYITIIALVIDVALWAITIMLLGIFPNFKSAFIYSMDSFSTLGGNQEVPEPWELLGPMIGLDGIVIIAFAVSFMYGIMYPGSTGA